MGIPIKANSRTRSSRTRWTRSSTFSARRNKIRISHRRRNRQARFENENPCRLGYAEERGAALRRHRLTAARTDALSKVARVTLAFWIIKILATTLSETGGDALSM